MLNDSTLLLCLFPSDGPDFDFCVVFAAGFSVPEGVFFGGIFNLEFVYWKNIIKVCCFLLNYYLFFAFLTFKH